MNVIWYNILEILIIYAVFWGSHTFSAICLEKLFYFLDECPPAEKRFDCRHFLICESSESLMAIKSDFIFFASKAPLPQQQGDHSHELQDNCSAPFRFHHLCLLPPCTQTLPRGDRRWRRDPGKDRRWKRLWIKEWNDELAMLPGYQVQAARPKVSPSLQKDMRKGSMGSKRGEKQRKVN